MIQDTSYILHELEKLSENEPIPLSYLDTDGTLSANSDTKVPSQKAVKTYADNIPYICKYFSGVATLTGGAGDLTINVPFDWTGGFIKVFISFATTKWTDEIGAGIEPRMFECSYDSLTNSAYTAMNIFWHSHTGGQYHQSYIKTASAHGMPNSATTTSFSLKDLGTTVYIKYFLWS